MLANLEGVGDETDRGGVEDDIVVLLTEEGDDLAEVITGQELGGVGRYRTGQEQVEVIVDTRALDLAHQGLLGDLLQREQIGHALEAVGDAEEAAQGRLADVEAAEDDLLTQQGKGNGQIGSIEGLTFSRGGGGEADDLLVAREHELDIGTHGSEDLVNLVVLIGLYHDACLLLDIVGSHSDIGNDGQVGEFGNILMALDLIAEQGKDPDDESRNEECHDKGTGKNNKLLGAYHTLDKRFVNELTIVGSGCQGDAVLLTFLEEQHIQR